MFNQYFVNVLRNHYADFEGKAARAEFWYYVLFYFLISIAVGLLAMLVGNWISYICSLALLVPSLAITVRRLQDIGKSGWWVFIAFIPVIGAIWLIILLAKPSAR